MVHLSYVHLSISYRIVLFCGCLLHTHGLPVIVNKKKSHSEHAENPKKKEEWKKNIESSKVSCSSCYYCPRGAGVGGQGLEHLITLFHRSNFQAVNHSPTCKTFSRFVYESYTNEWMSRKKNFKSSVVGKKFSTLFIFWFKIK